MATDHAGAINSQNPGTEPDEKTNITTVDKVSHQIANNPVYKTHDGYELVPTPSKDPNDPLNWTRQWKLLLLFSVCCSSLIVAFTASGIIPGLLYIARDYNCTVLQVSYLISVSILWLALGPIIWSALCDTYGRRPVYLGSMFITLVGSIACAEANSYGVQVFTRMLQGFGSSGAIAAGAGSIADVFFLHERGLYNGIWIATLQTGSFLAPIICGPVIQAMGWRWAFWVMCIFSGVFLALIFFCLPETLFIRHISSQLDEDEPVPQRKRLFAQVSLPGRISPNPLDFVKFLRPLHMLRYPSVGLMAVSWCVGISMPDVGIATIVPVAFGKVYGWNASAQGLSNLGPLVGCLVGEAFAGAVSDRWITYRTKKNGGTFIPEMRLTPMIPGLILMPLGLAGFGICIEHETHWMGPISMMAVTIFGYQQLLSLGMAYGIDCYKPQAPYVAAALTLCRQLFGFTVSYWLIPWVTTSGFQNSYIEQAAVVSLFSCGPMVMLMVWGRQWREASPVPHGFGTE